LPSVPRSKYGDKEYLAFKKIYDFSKETATEIRFGTGAYGSFSPIFEKISSKSLYTLGTNGRLSFNFEWIEDREFVKRYGQELIKTGFDIPENFAEIRPSVLPDEWVSRVDIFIDLVRKLL
jgi:hypothetical protein